MAPAPALAAAAEPAAGAPLAAENRRAPTKRSRAPRKSVTDNMKTPAEKLWSGKTRGLLEFERIAPTNGLSMGAIGVVAGSKGAATFYSYLKQPAVMARLEAEGFVRGDKGTLLHPWYLPLGPGVVSPCDKELKRSKQLRLRQEVAALHGELSDGTMIAAMDEAMADHGAHYPNTRPCSICGYGDDSGTIRHCDLCNEPFHDSCAGAPPVAGDWFCAACK